jgi:integrase
MEHELAHYPSLAMLSNPLSSASVPLAARTSAESAMSPLARLFIRHGSAERLETLFSRLKDGALLIAALSYGLELSASEICSMRVRDVNIAAQSVVIKARVYQVPKMVLDDLREYLQEKLCGYEASISLSKRDQLLFSEVERSIFQREVVSWWRIFKATQQCAAVSAKAHRVWECAESTLGGLDVGAKIVDKALSLIGRAHRHRAVKRKVKLSSVLDLFDKGPRIVRRNRSGGVTAYYVWRARML